MTNLLQMIVASLGLASIILKAQALFMIIKWAGVAYLIYLGIKLICSNNDNRNVSSQRTSVGRLYLQGFLTSAANPKAVIFFAALFPQFIDTSSQLLNQFAILSITYLTIDGLFLCCYGKFADALNKNQLPSIINTRMNYLAGSLLIGAAILLGLRDIEQN